jgi:nucleoside-diphosphate-sugar epimerase
MREIERLEALLKTIDTVILTAAAWGGAQDTYDINVSKTLTLLGMLDPDACKQVIYFSTESILDRNNQPLKQAKELGTDYIRTKALCHQQMARLAIAPKVTTLFPTLVFGGDEQKPKSHLSAGIRDVVKWIGWIRFLKADGSFHIVHARDIAFVVKHLVDHPPAADAPRELVLGSPAITVNQAIEEACAYFHKRIYLRLPLSMWLADVLIKVFKIEMASWDRFCLEYRHFTHRDPVSPATFGGVPYCANISDLFKLSGIPPA